MLAAHRDAFNFRRVGQPLDGQQSRAALGGMPGNAAERPLIAHRGNRRATHGVRTRALGHGRQLALAAERRQRRHGGRRDLGIVLGRLLEQLPDGMVANPGVGLVAGDVGQHGRIGDARHGRPPHPRVGIVLGKAAERREVTRIGLVHGFNADVGIGMSGLGLRTELVEDSHGVSDPGGSARASRCLSFGCVLRQAPMTIQGARRTKYDRHYLTEAGRPDRPDQP